MMTMLVMRRRRMSDHDAEMTITMPVTPGRKSPFGPKKIDRVGRGSGKVKILPRMGLAFGLRAL